MAYGYHKCNKIFPVCPFCNVENFIEKHCGDVFFLNVPATMFFFGSDDLKVKKEFIAREHFRNINFVAETSCNFTKNVMDNRSHSGLKCETEIQKIGSADDTPKPLTKKILKEQICRLGGEILFGKEIATGTILLHLLLTVKIENKIEEIR